MPIATTPLGGGEFHQGGVQQECVPATDFAATKLRANVSDTSQWSIDGGADFGRRNSLCFGSCLTIIDKERARPKALLSREPEQSRGIDTSTGKDKECRLCKRGVDRGQRVLVLSVDH